MRSIRRNFLYNIILNVSKVLFPLITAPYISRILAPEGVGLFNFANTYAWYFAMVALLGIPTYGIREVAKCRDDKDRLTTLMSELVSIVVIMTAATTFIYLLTVAFIPKLNQDAVVFLIIGAVLYLSPFSIDWYFSGLEEFRYITLRSIAIKAIGVALMFLLVHSPKDLIIYVVINVMAGVTNNIWNYVKMWRSGIKPRFVLTGLRKHMKPVLILFASSVAISIYTVLDVLMLGFMKGDSEVAYYTCASNISRMVVAAITSFSAVAIPRISMYLKSGEKGLINDIVNKSLSVVSFLAFPAAVGIACVSQYFTPLFYGDQFYGTIIPLQIMAFLTVAIGLNNLTGVQVLIGLGKDRAFLISVVTGACANFLMNLLLIPKIGAIGASAASVAAELIILAVMLGYVYKDTFVRFDKGADVAKSALLPILFIPLIRLLSAYMEGWTLVIVFCVTGFALYVALQYLLRNSSVLLIEEALVNRFKKK